MAIWDIFSPSSNMSMSKYNFHIMYIIIWNKYSVPGTSEDGLNFFRFLMKQ